MPTKRKFVPKNTSYSPFGMSRLGRWGLIMNASFNKRISIASCWAASRIALLDSVERYEDSYAISQEFCEWITCINTYPEGLKASSLKVPNFQKENFDADELLEL